MKTTTVEKQFSALSLKFNSQFPFIHIKLCKVTHSVNGESCEFSIKGVLLTLILALLPRYWDACPWSTGAGIAIGAGIAALWSLYSFIIFRVKVRMISNAHASESVSKPYHGAPLSRQEQFTTDPPNTPFDVTQKYFMLKKGNEFAAAINDNRRHLFISETAADIQLIVSHNPTYYEGYKPSLQHVDTIVQLAQRFNACGIRMVADKGTYNRPLTDITSQRYADMLEDTLKEQKALYAILNILGDDTYYFTCEGTIIACISEGEARELALQHTNNYKVVAMDAQQLIENIKHSSGITIMDRDGATLYQKSKEHVLRILRFEQPTRIDWNTDFQTHLEHYASQDVSKNTFFAHNVRLLQNSKDAHHNSNILMVGDACDDAKSLVAPNLYFQDSNFIVTTPNTDLLWLTEERLQERGYDIKVLNLVDMTKSEKYNPFDYVKTDADVELLCRVLIQNTNEGHFRSVDPFWEKATLLTLQACVLYMLHTQPKDKHNFATIYDFIHTGDKDKIQEIILYAYRNAQSPKDFEIAAKMNPKALQIIILGLALRLSPFVSLDAVNNITNESTIDLCTMQEGKKALFIIASEESRELNFLVSMLLSQLTQIARGQQKSRRLSVFMNTHNCGRIHDLGDTAPRALIDNMSIAILSPTVQSLQTLYPEWNSLADACDTLVYMGLRDDATIDYVANAIHQSHTLGSASPEQIKADLKSIDQDECIVMIRGIKPFKDKKIL